MNVAKKFIATIDHKKLFVSAGVKPGMLKTNHWLFILYRFCPTDAPFLPQANLADQI